MLIASVVILVVACFKASRTRGAIPTVAASVPVLVGVHALFDFSLQIQAITLTYMAVLGAGVANATAPTEAGIAFAGPEANAGVLGPAEQLLWWEPKEGRQG